MYMKGRSRTYFKRVCHNSGRTATGGAATVSIAPVERLGRTSAIVSGMGEMPKASSVRAAGTSPWGDQTFNRRASAMELACLVLIA